MAMGPSAIGQNGATVRTAIQTAFDNIDQIMLDPIYVNNPVNNKAPAGSPSGTLVFQFTRQNQQLNNAEIASIQDSWSGQGWSSAVAVNNSYNPSDPSMMSWTFTLTYNP